MNPVILRCPGSSLLLAFDTGEPQIVHWGADLGESIPDLSVVGLPIAHSALDFPVTAGLLPQPSSGWLGRPGLRGSRRNQNGEPGFAFSPALRLTEVRPAADGRAVRLSQEDRLAGLRVISDLHLHRAGLLEISHELHNLAETPYELQELAIVLPVPAEASELLDLTGRWCRENHPQRHTIQQGTWVRSGRHGRTGHDSSLLVAVGSKGFSNRSGNVWAVHFGWSGNHEQYLDALPDGRRMLGATELLSPGEVVIGSGDCYRTPSLYAAFSAEGIDGVTRSFYEWFRSRPNHVATRTGRVRPVVLNTWEAVYFDHDPATLVELANVAADLGVERFVLDDGWFRGRRDDTAGLGDWYVDEHRWPEGLHPLVDAVTGRGMEFGLWVEPEMVNPDSDVAREHPDWMVRPTVTDLPNGGRLPLEWRHQQVIDLANPDAWRYVFDRIDALLSEYDIAYLKWDQNRDSHEHGHAGRPAVHAQTTALYRLFEALKSAHPKLEIESCSSGGARIDLGILQRSDRVWPSDCNDALERQTIQRWTQAVVPPELTGAHIGPTRSHTTGRTHDITFRAITALFGHLGIEWDIRQATEQELAVLRRIIALYKTHRALLHSGTRVNADIAESELTLHGVVSEDRSEALFAAVVHGSIAADFPGRIPLPGLSSSRMYRVEAIMPTAEDLPVTVEGDAKSPYVQLAPPPWLATGAEATGTFLEHVGISLPILRPEHALLLRAVALDWQR